MKTQTIDRCLITVFLAALVLLKTQILHGQESEPVPRIYHSMVALAPGEGSLVFGGFTEHKWSMDLFDIWALKPPQLKWHPLGQFEPGDSQGAAFDEESNRVIVFSLSGKTWAFNPQTSGWQRMNPAKSPSGRCGHRIVYDRHYDRVILYGGFACTGVEDPLLGDTWAYDYNADRWEQMAPRVSPPARIYHAMAYDSTASRVVVWGGRVADKAVWSYDYGTDQWQRHHIAGGPMGTRAYQSMTYVPQLKGILAFGGLDLADPFSFEGVLKGDTWLLNLTQKTWRKLEPKTSPAPRSHHAAVFDRGLGRVILYGGELKTAYSGIISGEVWLLDPRTMSWSQSMAPDD